jgi:polyisoprenoid-binding protein YceI
LYDTIKEYAMTTATHTLSRTVDTSVVPSAGRWEIDPAHTSAEFVGRHLMVTKVRGSFQNVSGSIVIADDPLESEVEVVIDATSLSTGAADRDGHLKSADFFDVDSYPEIRFVSTSVLPNGSSWKLEGDLTIKDVTKSVVLDFDFVGLVDDPWGNSKAAFSASTEVLREDWGLNWNVALESGGLLVSKKIVIEIEVQASPAS